jgi:hypothetical protein
MVRGQQAQVRGRARRRGTLQSAESFRIKDFLSSNLFPYQWVDLDRDAAMRELAKKHSPETCAPPGRVPA